MAIGAVVGGTCTAMSPLNAFQSLGFNEGLKYAKSVISAETIMFTSQLFISPALWFDLEICGIGSFVVAAKNLLNQ